MREIRSPQKYEHNPQNPYFIENTVKNGRNLNYDENSNIYKSKNVQSRYIPVIQQRKTQVHIHNHHGNINFYSPTHQKNEQKAINQNNSEFGELELKNNSIVCQYINPYLEQSSKSNNYVKMTTSRYQMKDKIKQIVKLDLYNQFSIQENRQFILKFCQILQKICVNKIYDFKKSGFSQLKNRWQKKKLLKNNISAIKTSEQQSTINFDSELKMQIKPSIRPVSNYYQVINHSPNPHIQNNKINRPVSHIPTRSSSSPNLILYSANMKNPVQSKLSFLNEYKIGPSPYAHQHIVHRNCLQRPVSQPATTIIRCLSPLTFLQPKIISNNRMVMPQIPMSPKNVQKVQFTHHQVSSPAKMGTLNVQKHENFNNRRYIIERVDPYGMFPHREQKNQNYLENTIIDKLDNQDFIIEKQGERRSNVCLEYQISPKNNPIYPSKNQFAKRQFNFTNHSPMQKNYYPPISPRSGKKLGVLSKQFNKK